MKDRRNRSVDEFLMRECFRLALKGIGRVSPNPLVGAVLVKNGKVAATGYHHRFGAPHAEVDCLMRAKGKTRGATLYVNLEPCSHFGKTPPCTDLIARSRISRVVIGMKDPNPRVSGRGIRTLRSAGIRVDVGVLEEEARLLNRVFATHIRTGRPYVHLKIAQSVDGFIEGATAGRRWITSLPAREWVHRRRAEYDAILVGAGTIRKDNPRLTTRLVYGRDPDVVILDGRLSIPVDAKVLRLDRARRIIVCTSAPAVRRHPAKTASLAAAGALVLVFEGRSPVLQLRKVLKRLYQLRIGSILVEGGRDVFTQFLGRGPVDEISLFIAPRFLKKGVPTVQPDSDVRRLFAAKHSTVGFVGDDTLITTIRREN